MVLFSPLGWPQSGQDPFEQQLRSQETAEKEWQSAHLDFYARLDSIDTCRPGFRDSLMAIQQKMVTAFKARRDYISHWLELVKRRSNNSEQLRLSIPANVARLRKDLERATDQSRDALRRRDELIGSGHARDSMEVQAANELGHTTGKEAADFRELLDQLEAERLELMAAAEQNQVLVETLLKRLRMALTEQSLWDNFYGKQSDRGRLACREGFK
jgi:hypothetical protein